MHGSDHDPSKASSQGADAPCPHCLGPLSRDGHLGYACEVGHRFAGDDLHRAAAGRSTIALWSAKSALDAEAQVLRAMASSGRSDLWDRAEALETVAAELRAVMDRYEHRERIGGIPSDGRGRREIDRRA